MHTINCAYYYDFKVKRFLLFYGIRGDLSSPQFSKSFLIIFLMKEKVLMESFLNIIDDAILRNSQTSYHRYRKEEKYIDKNDFTSVFKWIVRPCMILLDRRTVIFRKPPSERAYRPN